jgi:hypothetical protein
MNSAAKNLIYIKNKVIILIMKVAKESRILQ